MTKQLEQIIKDISGEEGRIADLNFAYQNSWLLDKLRARGDHIKFQQWDKLNVLNKEITTKLHEPGIMESLLIPKCAFVSIESETAYNIICSQSSIEFDFKNNQKLSAKITEAPEPTNVIWENRDFDKSIRYSRLILVITVVLIVLFLTFLATVEAKAMTNDLIGKYDDSINCEELDKMFGYKVLEKLAADEWNDYYKNGGMDIDR